MRRALHILGWLLLGVSVVGAVVVVLAEAGGKFYDNNDGSAYLAPLPPVAMGGLFLVLATKRRHPPSKG